jgi:multiple sugar transport system ATP-binding protein
VVFNGGRIEQAGTPFELYERPANLFVAGFLGSPRMNFLEASLVGERGAIATVRLAGGAQVEVAADAANAAVGAKLTLGVRPEHLRLLRAEGAETGGIPGTVGLVEYLGDVTLAYVQVEGMPEMVAVKCGGGQAAPGVGTRVLLAFEPQQAYLFGADGAAMPARERSARTPAAAY